VPVGKDQDVVQKKHKLIQIRTIVFLNNWVEKFSDDFLVPGMQELVLKLDEITKGDYSLSKSLEKTASKDRKFHRKVCCLVRFVCSLYVCFFFFFLL
jgi:hypothetical protein